MNIKLNFNEVNVKDATENLNVKILMVKGEKGDPGSGAEWGDIGGTLAEQTDLMNVLGNKANTSDLNNYYTKTQTDTEIQNAIDSLGTVFNLVGSVATVNDLPSSGNEVGDVYYVQSESAGFIWINDDGTLRWEELGMTVDLTAYYTKTETNNLLDDKVDATDLSPVATSGSYNDLSNKPTIPTKDELVNVSSSVDEDYRVNLLKGKNLFKQTGIWTNHNITYNFNNSELLLNGTSDYEGGYIGMSSTPSFAKLPAGTYKLSFSEISGTRSGSANIIIRNVDTNTNFVDTVFSASSTYTFTLTTDTNVGLNLYQLGSDRVYNNYKIGIQIEKGNTATSYEPYITPSIYVDNEMLVSKNVYSTGEVVIGEWLGKPLYRKVVDCGALPNNAQKNVNHNITNIDKIVKIYGYSKSSTGATFSLPFPALTLAGNISVFATNTSIAVSTGTDRTSFTETYITLEYTKTTD